MNNQGFSKITEKLILDHIFGGPNYVRPEYLYICLLIAAINKLDTGTTILAKEPDYTGYIRLKVANTIQNFPAAIDFKKNAVVFTFGQCTAGSAVITHWAITDAPVGGTIVTFGELEIVKPISAGDTPSIPINGMTIGLN
ncbi:MAG: hypothetical protein V1799_07755 [bacterium]